MRKTLKTSQEQVLKPVEKETKEKPGCRYKMYDEKLREEKIALSELKERISQFLYQHFIDFERDRGVKIQDQILNPAFVIPKHEIVIECFKLAEPDSPDFAEKAQLYLADGVKFLPLDLRVLASRNVETALREQLPQLGCSL